MSSECDKLEDTVQTSSDYEPPLLCQPCLSEGTSREAEGYCQTCAEHLCGQCYNAHTIPRPTRYHVLLDKLHMPLTGSRSTPSALAPCTIPCTKHPREVLKFVCNSHDTVVCGVCSVLSHQRPCRLKYIPDVHDVSDYKKSTEYKELLKRLDSLESNVDAGIDDVNINKGLVEEKMNSVLELIRELRKEIDEYFDRREKMLMETVALMQQEDEHSLQTVLEGLTTLKANVKESREKLESFENEACNLYASSKNVSQRISEFENTFEGYMKENVEPEYSFKSGEAIGRLLSSNVDFGVLERSYKDQEVHQPLSKLPNLLPSIDFRSATATKLSDVNVLSQIDKCTPVITGLVHRSPNELLVVDQGNDMVKAVDIDSNKVKSQLVLTGSPFDITNLPGNREAAVTLPYDHSIQVISTQNRLSPTKTISVNGSCQGICSTSQNIVVSFDYPSMVQVIDLEGKVLTTIRTTIHTNIRAEKLFKEPYYVTASTDGSEDIIYVSDFRTGTISKFNTRGDLVATYKNFNAKGPYGVFYVANKGLLVCNNEKDTIDVIGSDDRVFSLLNKLAHGIGGPVSVCYCQSRNMLYVGVDKSGSGTPVVVYKLSN